MKRNGTGREVQPRSLPSRIGLASALLAAIVLMVPMASAAGSGYSQSFTQSAGHSSNSAVDLVSVSSTDGGGATISVTLQVSGTLVLNSANYLYEVFFGGAATSNATAYAVITNGASVTWISTIASSGSYGQTTYTVGGGGSSMTFSLNKTTVGPSSTFSLNVWAAEGTAGSGAYSWLGSDYLGLGGGGGSNCGTGGCPSVNTAISTFVWIAVGVAVTILVVIVLVVVLVVMPKRRTPPPMAPMMVGSPPPPPPPSGSPPPPLQ